MCKDQLFKERLEDEMSSWQRVREFQDRESRQLGILFWWEYMVKPGIRKPAIQRSKEINTERREELNLLLLRQVYHTRKLQLGQQQTWGIECCPNPY